MGEGEWLLYHFNIRGIRKITMDVLFKDFTHANNFTLMISSLYGMYRSIEIDDEKEVIDFSKQIPFIVADDMVSKVKFSVNYGNVYGLCNTAIKNVNEASNCISLIRKKGLFQSLLMKK